jgi:hypothetical protein
MPVPVDPWPNFINGTSPADGDQVDQRFKALYDALDPAQAGIDASMVKPASLTTPTLANGAVTSAKLGDGAVTGDKLEATALVKFLQLHAPASLKVAFGSSVANFMVSAEILQGTIAHGLGVVPIWQAATLKSGGLWGGGLWTAGVAGKDVDNISFAFGSESAFAPGNQALFDWIAVG